MISESEISVQGHGVHTAYLELTNALRARGDCKVVVNHFFKPVHADIVHIHTIGLLSLTKLLFSRGKKVVSAHIIPASLVGSIAGANKWLPIARVYMKFFYRRADKILAVSSGVALSLEKELGVSKSKIQIMYNTIDTSVYKTTLQDKKNARETLKLKQDQKIVVGNGQIQPRKRFDTFLYVAKQLPSAQFIWVGGIPFKNVGADYKKMQKLIDSTPENLKVTGVIELSEVKNYLQAADVFMLPAEQENHPMAVIEAAAASLPLVLRDIPEYDDTFRPNAMFCSTDEAFSKAIDKLFKDEGLQKKMIAEANQIASRFDSRTGAEQAMSIYKELLK